MATSDLHEKKSLRTHALSTCGENVDFIDQPISYEQFLKEYLIPNKICHFGQWATDGWMSTEKWVTECGEPNTSYLTHMFGSSKDCAVANCNTHKYDTHCKTEMDFKDYMDYLENGRKRSSEESDVDCLYLKDWHFTKVFPDYKAYEVPVFFKSDWLNEFLDEHGWEKGKQCDDYRFVYIGPKGSWTPFHSDVLRSHSWSANICGAKRWVFFPPGEEDKLRDRFGQLPFDLNSPDLSDTVKYPHGVQTAKRMEVVQRRGEVIFVPSGWHHQVINLEHTISINHNWINGSNIDLTWQFLCSSLRDVEREISDCRDMEGWQQQCQIILKATAGVDFVGFYTFIAFIAEKRLSALKIHKENCDGSVTSAIESLDTQAEGLSINQSVTQGGAEIVIGNQLEGGRQCETVVNTGRSMGSILTPASLAHEVFDLIQIRDVLIQMLKETEFMFIADTDASSGSSINPIALLKMIKTALRGFSF